MKRSNLIFSIISLLAISAFIYSCSKKDTTPPKITLLGTNPIVVTLNTTYTDPGATALDDEDGDLTASIVIQNPVNVNKKAKYTVNYTVTDAEGNLGSATRTVFVVNQAEFLAGNFEVTDNKVDPSGTPATATYDEKISAADTLNNRIWFTKFGSYDAGKVYAERAGNVLSIPQQEVLCGTPPVNRRFLGTGTIIDSTKIIINYTEIVGGVNYTCSGNYQRK